MEYLRPELLILVPVLIGTGQLAKMQGLQAKRVPFLLLLVGILAASVYGFVTTEYVGWRMILDAIVVTGMLHGSAAAFIAMGMYDTTRSAARKE